MQLRRLDTVATDYLGTGAAVGGIAWNAQYTTMNVYFYHNQIPD